MNIQPKKKGWKAFSWFLLRGTGMPFDWLEAGVGRLLWECTRTEIKEETEASRQRLWERSLSDIFREALFLCSPDIERHSRAWDASFAPQSCRNRKARRRERALLRYLQRFCAKNDSNSFFGAVAAGRFDKIENVEQVRPIITDRSVFITQWIAEALIGQARSELAAAGLEVEFLQRSPSVSLDSRAALYEIARDGSTLVEKSRSDHPAAAAVIMAADGKTTTTKLIDKIATAQNFAQEDIRFLIAELKEKGLLQSWFEFPSGLIDPLAESLRKLEQQMPCEITNRWRRRFLELSGVARIFKAADLGGRRALTKATEEQLTDWLKSAPTRRTGEFYASRSFVQEMGDRTGKAIGVGKGWTDQLTKAVGDYAEFCMISKRVERLKFKGWFQNTFPKPFEPQLWRQVQSTFAQDWIGYEINTPPEASELIAFNFKLRQKLRERLSGYLEHHGSDGVLQIRPDAWPAALTDSGALQRSEDQSMCFVNPDLMMATSPEGNFSVLSEAHHLPNLTGCLLPALRCQPELVSDTTRELSQLCAPALPAFIWSYQHSFISVTPDFGGVAMELSGSAPPEIPRSRRIAFPELKLMLTDRGFQFSATNYQGELIQIVPISRLSGLDLASALFPVSLPDVAGLLAGGGWEEPTHMPRVMWGELVIQRRRWKIQSADWTSPRTLSAAVCKLRELAGEGLPRFTFVKAAGELKPILFDWADPLSAEVALALARKNPVLRFEEMLPGPEQLWLRSEAGRHTSEFRTVFFREL